MTATRTAEQAALLNELRSAAFDLESALRGTIQEATEALERLTSGQRPSGMFTVLHHEPVKVEQAAAKVETLLTVGRALGCSNEDAHLALTKNGLGETWFTATDETVEV